MKRAAKVLVFFSFGLLFLFGVGLLAFYHLVEVGEFRAFMVGEIERRTDFKIQLGDGELEMGRILGVGFRDVILSEPSNDQPAITAARVTARVALLPLLHRRVIVSEIRLQDPRLHLSRDAEGNFPLFDRLSNLPFLKDNQGQFSFDLRAIKVARGEVRFEDHSSGSQPNVTVLHDLTLNLERPRGQVLRDLLRKVVRKTTASGQALEFGLATKFERNGQEANINADGTVVFPGEKFQLDKARWILQTHVREAPLSLAHEFVESLPSAALGGTFDARLQLEGQSKQKWQASGNIKFTDLTVVAPEMFAAPLNAGNGQVVLVFEWLPEQWDFPRLELTGNDFKLKARAALRVLANGRKQIQFSAVTPVLQFAALKKYVPAKWIASSTLDKVLAGIAAGEITIKDVGLSAEFVDMRQWRWESLGDRFRFDADLRNVSGNFADGTLPVRGVQGRLIVGNGLLSFKNGSGSYGQTHFEALDGSYGINAQSSATYSVRGRGTLELAEAREQLNVSGFAPRATKLLQAVSELAGTAAFDLALKSSGNAPVEVDAKLGLADARLHTDGYMLTEINGDVALNNDAIKIDKLHALLNGSPVDIRLTARDYAAENGAFDLVLESNGVKAGVVTTLLNKKATLGDPGVMRGWVRYRGPLASRAGRRLSGHLNLANVQYDVQPLLQPLRELNGVIQFDEAGIDFQNIKGLIVGVPASVNARWRFGQKTPLFFDLSAPEMDLSYLLTQLDVEASEFYANLEAVGKVSLGRGRYNGFDFTDLKTDIFLDHRVWNLSKLILNTGGGTVEGSAKVNHRPDVIEVSAEPRMQSVSMQNLLGWFDGAKADMSGKVNISGRLTSFGRDGSERLHNVSGVFNLKIEDGTIRRLRLLVQILNFLDLSRWFTFQVPDLSKRGIDFRAITADFRVERGVYTTDNLIVDSDDLRMTGSGKIDSSKDEIEFVVAVRPFARMDTGLNQIPLIGTGIAAIKNSFLVASVNIKGPMEAPTITPAPLSTLSEIALGVLRIPRSILILPTGEKKEAAGALPPQ